MRRKLLLLLLTLGITGLLGSAAHAAVTPADAKYAQAAGQATDNFSKVIGDWGDVYQAAPDKATSPEFKQWMKKAAAADASVKAALTVFAKLKVSPGYKNSDVALRKFIKAYGAATDLYAPAIKKNDKKLVKQANDALVQAAALFTAWGNEFAKDSAALAK